MNRFIRNNILYFSLGLIVTAMVPVATNAQVAPDDSNGATMDGSEDQGPAVKRPPRHLGEGKPPVPNRPAGSVPGGAPAQSGSPAAASGSSDRKLTPFSYSYVGGTIGGGTSQGFAVGADVGRSSQGAGIRFSNQLGTYDNIFTARLQLSGLRTNGYLDDQGQASVTPTVVFNGTASIGTNKGANLNGLAAFGVVLPFRAGDWFCRGVAGAGGGAAWSNRIQSEQKRTAAAGPGLFAGFSCDVGRISFALNNHGIGNPLRSIDPNNQSLVVLQHALEGTVRINNNFAITANATVDVDAADGKSLGSNASFTGALVLSKTWDVGIPPKSNEAK